MEETGNERHTFRVEKGQGPYGVGSYKYSLESGNPVALICNDNCSHTYHGIPVTVSVHGRDIFSANGVDLGDESRGLTAFRLGRSIDTVFGNYGCVGRYASAYGGNDDLYISGNYRRSFVCDEDYFLVVMEFSDNCIATVVRRTDDKSLLVATLMPGLKQRYTNQNLGEIVKLIS